MLADTRKILENGKAAVKLRDIRLGRMKKRADFQRLTASPSKYFTPSLVIQTAPCRQLSHSSEELTSEEISEPQSDVAADKLLLGKKGLGKKSLGKKGLGKNNRGKNLHGKLGFTASRKVGNAVRRNRAKRRMRAASDRIMSGRVRQDWDFVLVAREATVTRPWAELLADLESGLRKLRAFS